MLTKKIKYEYTCLLCNFKFESETEIESQLCPKCLNMVKTSYPESQKVEPVIPKEYNYPSWYFTSSDPCLGCSNHPRNGGSGICHCTIPYMRRGY